MRRKPNTIQTTELCSYGCGNQAKFLNHSNRLMCEISSSKCPEIRNKNKIGSLLSYKNGKDAKKIYQNKSVEAKNKMAWAKGLTRNDPRIAKFANAQCGKRRITDEEKLKKAIYREQCSFNLVGIIERIRGYHLLKKYGMSSHTKGNAGVVRDHRISIDYGYKNNIDPGILSHPANCEFLLHNDNARKSYRNSCTVEELLIDIKQWDCEGNSGIPQ